MRILESICWPITLPVMLALSAAIINLLNMIGAEPATGAAANTAPKAEGKTVARPETKTAAKIALRPDAGASDSSTAAKPVDSFRLP